MILFFVDYFSRTNMCYRTRRISLKCLFQPTVMTETFLLIVLLKISAGLAVTWWKQFCYGQYVIFTKFNFNCLKK